MKITKLQAGTMVFFLLVILFILIAVPLFKKRLIQNHKISNATITDCSYGGRTHVGTITSIYNFYYNKKMIDGIAAFNSSELNFKDAKLLFVGKAFPVAYNPDNPNNNYLLIRPKDFKKFNYSFPDSLHWIVRYVHSK
ncbi:hypothetical protein FW778_21345 [Ginsengibacter hankyongi]|uniref:DUF3592 domain-containing protein n=1 Tax=Ginsengibacter hankyongi TaxID=2607284 RepID=A0A5J5IBD8_9BACT|nr:DUF3592 domain-containing protein [Ginsengibacter hankyongi]KAA9035507.1 hypothetical protein FW778_21345 [Ginsengibacter hankyongi]